VFVKELFVSVRPLAGIEVQAGGLEFSRGESTEATSYDNDGWIVGERVAVRRSPARFLDGLVFTRGYLGDLAATSVFNRLHRLGTANYYQALALKHLARSSFSIDYTAHSGTHVVRGAANLDLSSLRVIDRIRLESYARMSPTTAYGYAITVQHWFSHRVMTAGGVSAIDDAYGGLNGDLYGIGRRLYGSISRRFGAAWLGSVQIARGIGANSPTSPRTRVDVALAYDVLRAWAMRSKPE
jgi:hypothetical protein